MACRDCALYDVERVKDKAGRIRKDRVTRCNWISTEVYPMSLGYGFNVRPSATFMEPNGGEGCPCFKPKE